jgi:hypothetical protein
MCSEQAMSDCYRELEDKGCPHLHAHRWVTYSVKLHEVCVADDLVSAWMISKVEGHFVGHPNRDFMEC